MTNLKKMQQWLQTFPGFGDTPIRLECTQAAPQGLGLYFRGREEVSRKEDILGRRESRCKLRFALQLQQLHHNGVDPVQLPVAQLQEWVQQQSALGLAPRFGDVPQHERLLTRLVQTREDPRSGTRLQEVELTAEFTKID